jgi:uncharacterized protein (DUF1499 family)
MKRILIYLAATALIVLVALIVLGQLSQSGKAPGMLDGRLQPCGDSPNCVCSEYPGAVDHHVEPIRGSVAEMALLRQLVVELGGKIEIQQDSYLAASFKSPLFGFTDDLEIRIDTAANEVQLRSAVRMGYNDLGVNRERVQRLRKLYQQRQGRD